MPFQSSLVWIFKPINRKKLFNLRSYDHVIWSSHLTASRLNWTAAPDFRPEQIRKRIMTVDLKCVLILKPITSRWFRICLLPNCAKTFECYDVMSSILFSNNLKTKEAKLEIGSIKGKASDKANNISVTYKQR